MKAEEILGGDIAVQAEALFRWWLAQLSSIADTWASKAVRRAPRPQLLLDERGALRLLDGTVAEMPCHAIPSSSISQMVPDPTDGAILIVQERRILRRKLMLPTTARRDLRAVLTHELDRQTPLDAQDAYFDYRIVHRDRAKHRIEVELSVVKRNFVAAGVEAANRLGFAIVEVRSDASSETSWRASFYRPSRISPQQRRQRRILALGAVAAGFLLLLLVVEDLHRRSNIAASFDRQLSEARVSAAAVDKLRQQADVLTHRLTYLQQRRENASLGSVMEEVARILPDDSWTREFEINGTKIRIAGLAASATELIARIDASPLFRDAHFISPVTRQSNSPLEQFDLGFELKTAAR